MLVVQRLAAQGQVALAAEHALIVVEIAGRHLQLAAGGDLALLAVVDLAADGQRGQPRANLADLSMLVAQAGGAEFQLAGLQRAAAVLRVLLQLDIQRGGALQHAAAVVQLIGAQRQIAVGCQRAGGGVVQLAAQLNPAVAGAQRLDAAAAVIQAGSIQLQAVALHCALLVVQRALQGQRQRLAAGQHAALVVQVLPHSQGLCTLAAQRALAVVELAGIQRQAAVAQQLALLVVEGLADLQLGLAGADLADVPGLVAERIGLQVQALGGDMTAIIGQAGLLAQLQMTGRLQRAL
ncbi:hypothetical protein VL02_09355, partial [Chromobacterium violaceum]